MKKAFTVVELMILAAIFFLLGSLFFEGCSDHQNEQKKKYVEPKIEYYR